MIGIFQNVSNKVNVRPTW